MLELPGLTPQRAAELAYTWDDGGLWADVAWLAGKYWSASSPGEQAVCWHHLVLAVGNFKRQTGRRLRPAKLSEIPTSDGTAHESLVTPAGESVHRDRPDTWGRLEATMRGAGVATTSSLLSALWPDDHFVFDWRVRSAANGLRIAAGLSPSPSVSAHIAGGRLNQIDFDDYVIVRAWMRTVACPLVTTERALYRLSQNVAFVAGRSWDDYSEAVASALTRLTS